jgi:hypothetical protein
MRSDRSGKNLVLGHAQETSAATGACLSVRRHTVFKPRSTSAVARWGEREGVDATNHRGGCRRAADPLVCEWFCGEADSEAQDGVGDAAGVHLEREALAELPELLGAGLGDAAEVDELGEEALEACGEMISRMRHGSSPAFQNVCHCPRGL